MCNNAFFISKWVANLLQQVDAIILVYDIIHVGSFQILNEWMKVIYKNYLGTLDVMGNPDFLNKLPFMALVGNKGLLNFALN